MLYKAYNMIYYMIYMIHGKNDETFQQFENALDPIKITSIPLVMNAISQEQIQKKL